VIVTVNGTDRPVADGTTVLSIVRDLGISPDGRGVAVAVNAAVVPRSDWARCPLAAGDRVEVLVAVGGG
jgi:sulfur carrier protein